MTTTPAHAGIGNRAAYARASDDDAYALALLKQIQALTEDDPRRERLRAEFVELHAEIVDTVAHRYAGRGEPLDDLRQVAYLGLVKAINRFDPAYGVPFRGYAIPLMIGEVKRHFRDTTWGVRVSRFVQEMRPRLRQAEQQFSSRHGRAPTTAEIATALGITEAEAVEIITWSNAYQPLSLDAPAGNDGSTDAGIPLGDNFGDDDPDLDLVVDGKALRRMLARLPERERTIVLLRFFGNQTQSQIAQQVGLSQMHVSRLLSSALQQLRTALLTDP